MRCQMSDDDDFYDYLWKEEMIKPPEERRSPSEIEMEIIWGFIKWFFIILGFFQVTFWLR